MAPHSDGQASFSAPHLTRIDPYGGRKVGLTGATVVHPFVHLFNLKQLYGADSLDESPCLNWPNVTGSHVADDPGRSLKVARRVRIPLGLRGNTSSEAVNGNSRRAEGLLERPGAAHVIFPAPGNRAGTRRSSPRPSRHR